LYPLSPVNVRPVRAETPGVDSVPQTSPRFFAREALRLLRYVGRPGLFARSKPRDLVAFGNRIAFTAIDEQHGRELWVSDGTAAGTYLVKDLFRRRRYLSG
jgi:ELWxxDGT repeat protein